MYQSIEAMLNNAAVLTGKKVGLCVVKKDRTWTAMVVCEGEVDVAAIGTSISDVLTKLDAECASLVMPA
jgi:hypothetical protein